MKLLPVLIPSSFYLPMCFLQDIKALIQDSEDSHEQAAYVLISDLEEIANTTITPEEFARIVGKAMDILRYFRYDSACFAQDCSGYRASVIHQMCCGMLRTVYLLRPDIYATMLRESEHDLYCYQPPMGKWWLPRPLTCKRW